MIFKINNYSNGRRKCLFDFSPYFSNIINYLSVNGSAVLKTMKNLSIPNCSTGMLQGITKM